MKNTPEPAVIVGTPKHAASSPAVPLTVNTALAFLIKLNGDISVSGESILTLSALNSLTF